jgi:hypothetical protein
MPTEQQQPDGSWVPVEPVPYTDTIDWEVGGRGRQRTAEAYWHDRLLARVPAGRFFRLRLALAHRRLVRALDRQG